MGKSALAAEELLAAFVRAIPAQKKQRMSDGEWTRALEKFHQEARQIRQRLSLGVLARARSAFILQQKLLAEGFPADVVRKLVFTLILNAFAGKG